MTLLKYIYFLPCIGPMRSIFLSAQEKNNPTFLMKTKVGDYLRAAFPFRTKTQFSPLCHKSLGLGNQYIKGIPLTLSMMEKTGIAKAYMYHYS